MVATEPVDRRRVLRSAVATASVVAIAGCGEDGNEPEAEEGTGNGQEREDTQDGADSVEVDEEDVGTELEGPLEDVEADADSWEDAQSILLYADADGWVGYRPRVIEDETNPTLELSAGTEYDLIYENADGEEHNISIWEEDETTSSVPISGEEGEVRQFTFEANSEMVEYHCEVHMGDMTGDVEIRDE